MLFARTRSKSVALCVIRVSVGHFRLRILKQYAIVLPSADRIREIPGGEGGNIFLLERGTDLLESSSPMAMTAPWMMLTVMMTTRTGRRVVLRAYHTARGRVTRAASAVTIGNGNLVTAVIIVFVSEYAKHTERDATDERRARTVYARQRCRQTTAAELVAVPTLARARVPPSLAATRAHPTPLPVRTAGKTRTTLSSSSRRPIRILFILHSLPRTISFEFYPDLQVHGDTVLCGLFLKKYKYIINLDVRHTLDKFYPGGEKTEFLYRFPKFFVRGVLL